MSAGGTESAGAGAGAGAGTGCPGWACAFSCFDEIAFPLRMERLLGAAGAALGVAPTLELITSSELAKPSDTRLVFPVDTVGTPFYFLVPRDEGTRLTSHHVRVAPYRLVGADSN